MAHNEDLVFDQVVFFKAVREENLPQIKQNLSALYKSTSQGRGDYFVIIIVQSGLQLAVDEDKLQALDAILATKPPRATKLSPLRMALSRGKIEAFRKIADSGVSLKDLEEIAKHRFDRPQLLSELFVRGVDPELKWHPSKTSQKTTTLLLEAARYEMLDAVIYIALTIEAKRQAASVQLAAVAGGANSAPALQKPASA